MLPLLWVVLILLGSVLVLLFQGASLYLAARMPHVTAAGSGASSELPQVSVVVAARDEEEDLPDCLDGLIRQSYPNLEIVVVDGGSTDGTARVAEARSPRVRLIREPPLPAGWVGKSFACQIGADSTSGEWLLFTDADVRYDPEALLTAVDWGLREKADLVTLAPRIEVQTFWERVVLPFYVQAVLTYFRTPRVNSDRSSAAMSNGQFLLVRRAAYDRLGGHARIRGYVLEDVAIARLFRTSGLRMRVGWSPELLTTRMYRTRAEMFEGISKNVHGTEFSLARQLGFLAALLGLFYLPLLVLPLGVIYSSLPLIVVGALLWFALFGKHVVFSWAVKAPAIYGLLFPVAVAFYIGVVSESISRGVRGRPIRWKNRSYPMNPTEGADAAGPGRY